MNYFLFSLSDTPGAFVRYYYEGQLKSPNLLPLETSTNLRLVKVCTNFVELACDNSSTQLNDIEDKVQYKAMGDDKWQTSSVVSRERRVRIGGLNAATEYTFRVHAPGQIFLRENSKPLQVTTLLVPISNTGDILLYFYYVGTFVFQRLQYILGRN